jgi:hypothetical protein
MQSWGTSTSEMGYSRFGHPNPGLTSWGILSRHFGTEFGEWEFSHRLYSPHFCSPLRPDQSRALTQNMSFFAASKAVAFLESFRRPVKSSVGQKSSYLLAYSARGRWDCLEDFISSDEAASGVNGRARKKPCTSSHPSRPS